GPQGRRRVLPREARSEVHRSLTLPERCREARLRCRDMTAHPRLHVPPGRLVGGIICESFRPGSRGLRGINLSLRSLTRYDVGGRDPAQPPIWTLLEFE